MGEKQDLDIARAAVADARTLVERLKGHAEAYKLARQAIEKLEECLTTLSRRGRSSRS